MLLSLVLGSIASIGICIIVRHINESFSEDYTDTYLKQKNKE